MKQRTGKHATKAELVRRAKKIKVLFSDCDGVLTDTGAYYSEWGESFKKFSIRDGMGVLLLRAAGIGSGFITGESTRSIQRRAEKLQIPHILMGVQNKYQTLKAFSDQHHIPLEEIAYIGDDVNDYEIIDVLTKNSLTAAPGDALPSIQKEVQYVCSAMGGHGAFREFADWILGLRGQPFQELLRKEIHMTNVLYQSQESL